MLLPYLWDVSSTEEPGNLPHSKSGSTGSRSIDRGPGLPRLQTSPLPITTYGASFWGSQPEEPHIPGHLQRARHLENRKNPFLPSAMEINDVQRDVRFVCYDDFWQGVWVRGTFLGSATTQPLPRGCGYKTRGLWAWVQLEDGQRALLSLCNAGIVKRSKDGYVDRVTISPRHEHLLPYAHKVPEQRIQRLRESCIAFPSRFGL